MCFYFQRMSANNSQARQNPAKSLILNNEHQSNTDLLLSMEIATTRTTATIMTTDHPTSSIELNPINMLVNVQQQQHHNVSPRRNSRPEEHPHQQQTQQQPNRQEQQLRLQQRQRDLQHELQRIQQQ